MATVKLRDGDITLYTRSDSAFWYAGYRLPEGGRLQESLKTSNKEEAKERAIARFDELRWRSKQGLTQDTVSFSEAADAWIEELEAQVSAGSRNKRTVIDYKPVVERYLKSYFAHKPIDSIRPVDITKYRVWRRDYWIKGPGAKLKHIEYARNGKTLKRTLTAKDRKAPSPRSVNGENVVLRGIFDHAVSNGWMTAAQIPKIENAAQKASDSRARAYPAFTYEEYHKLYSFMRQWVAEPNIPQKELWRRQAIQHFVIFLANSGLREHELYRKDERTGELRGLRWSDIEFFATPEGRQVAELTVTGKTGERKVIVQRTAAVWLIARRYMCNLHKETDFVMAMPDGSLPSGFDSGVKRLLDAAGLRKDPRSGRNRGIYSFRHSYATWRIQARRSIADIARNMGTSLAMIERHYYHFMPRDIAHQLTSGEAIGQLEEIEG